jgi:predicted ATPase/class 3 adenylate cyclase/DNA-binding CsgD family transcriptional regulator
MTSPEQAVSDLSEFRSRRVTASPPGPGALPSGTVTFLLTDIEGSTQAWERHGARMAEAVARHYDLLDAAVAARGGVRPLEQGEGDSLVAAFASASDAVAAALEAQQGLAEEAWPEGAEIAVRMALHTGEAQVRDDRFYVGPTIIRCARLRALGHGGQVLISSTTADLLADRLPAGAALLPLGLHRLRDLRQPERVFQLAHPAIGSQFPPLRSLDALPNNLPVQLTSFIGREAELAEVAAALAGHRLVTLVGAGGCGKTRLAAQAAAEVGDDYPGGAWWIDLGSVTDAALVEQAAMTALGLLDRRGMAPVERITRYLGDQRALLVLDNCEHVLEAAARLLDAVLRGCPHVSALATSREPLGVPGEWAWRVPALSLPAAAEQPPGEMVLASEAVRLFVDRATDARPTFRLDGANAATVAAICVRLDGMPLAIELAAARVRSLSPERILDGLSDRFRLLTGGARTAVARQQTLQASVEWSHGLLRDGEQILLRRLGVFVGRFTLEAAEEVCAGDPLEGWGVLTLLSDLADKSLVVFDGDRYRLLQTIRDFANSQLLAAGETNAIRDRHSAFFLRRAQGAAEQLERAAGAPLLEALEADHDNFRAALQWTLGQNDGDRTLRLVIALFPFWHIHGHYTEALGWYDGALEASTDRGALRVQGMTNMALLSAYGMNLEGGYGMVQAAEAVALADALGDESLALRARFHQSAMLGFMSPAQSIAALEPLIDAARRARDDWVLCCALFWRGFHASFHLDRPDLAATTLDELGEMAVRSGNPYWKAWHGIAAAIAPLRRGRLEEARRLLDRSAALADELDDPMLQSYCFVFRAQIPMAEGDYRAAATMAAERHAIQDRIGSLCRVEWFDLQLAEAHLAEGDLASARGRIDGIAAAVRAAGFPLVIEFLTLVDGQYALQAGDLSAARAAFEEAQSIATQLECPWYLAASGNRLGRLARAEGDAASAEDHHHQALALCARHGFRGMAALTLEALGSLAVAGEHDREAARLFGAAEALRETTSERRWAPDQPAYDADVAVLRDRLGDEALQQAGKEGVALSLEAAAAYASRARGERKRPSRGWASLTPTEVEVVALAATGLTNAEIAGRLFISPATVKTHLEHIYTLGADEREAGVRRAFSCGLTAAGARPLRAGRAQCVPQPRRRAADLG